MSQEGWTWVYGSRKWHYFIEGMSLCRKWALLGNPSLEQGNDDSPDNCTACRKILEKRRKKT